MHPRPPCSYGRMSNKTQIYSKPPRGGVDQDVVVIETRFTCSVFLLTLHLSASEHTAIDGTWTPIPIDLSGWNQYIVSAHARPTWASHQRWWCLQRGGQKTWQEHNKCLADTTYLLEVLKELNAWWLKGSKQQMTKWSCSNVTRLKVKMAKRWTLGLSITHVKLLFLFKRTAALRARSVLTANANVTTWANISSINMKASSYTQR